MKKQLLPFITIMGLLLVSCLVSWNSFLQMAGQKDTVDIKNFPKSFGEWGSVDLPISEEEYAILETRNVLARKYSAPGKTDVLLLLVYSQSNRKVSHPPEICYTGSGMVILNNTPDSIDVKEQNLIVKANRLLLDSNGDQQFSFYWFKVGDTFTSNYWKQQLIIALKTMIGKPPSSALVRVSADVKDGDLQRAIQDIKSLSRLFIPALNQYLP